MGNIEYKKTLTIKGKIIKEDDVLRIAHLLHSQFRTGDYTEEYEILFEDQSSLTGNDSVAILSSDEFRKRQSQRLWLTYKSKEFERRITVCIYNSFLLPTESTIEISSIDRDWYNSICNQMATIINEMEHQKITFPPFANYIVSAIASLVESLIFSWSLSRLFPNSFSNSQKSAIVGLSCMILMSVNLFLFGLIEKAYPNVEFAFGPSYLSKSLKIRHIFGIFIPLVIDLIFFALGYTQ